MEVFSDVNLVDYCLLSRINCLAVEKEIIRIH